MISIHQAGSNLLEFCLQLCIKSKQKVVQPDLFRTKTHFCLSLARCELRYIFLLLFSLLTFIIILLLRFQSRTTKNVGMDLEE